MAVTACVFSRLNLDLWETARALEEVDRLNFGGSGFMARFIARELTSMDGAAVLLLDGERVVGYTAAIDAKEVYGSNIYYRGRDALGAAYISNSSLHPDYQHKGYIWMMMEALETALRAKGYVFLDRDTKADLGYADKVVAQYGERIVFANPPENTEWGSQRYIR